MIERWRRGRKEGTKWRNTGIRGYRRLYFTVMSDAREWGTFLDRVQKRSEFLAEEIPTRLSFHDLKVNTVIRDVSRMNENCGLDLRMEPPFARAPVNDRWDGSILYFTYGRVDPLFSALTQRISLNWIS